MIRDFEGILYHFFGEDKTSSPKKGRKKPTLPGIPKTKEERVGSGVYQVYFREVPTR